MHQWLKELDDLLRGKKTELGQLAEGTRHIRLPPLVAVSLALGIIYGLFMGLFAVLTRTPPNGLQLVASAIKTPALFFLTLVVTFPSLYVFSALLGVRLSPVDTLRLVVAAIAVNLAVLASFALINLLFTISTTSYHFMVLLNVVFFTIAGLIGLGFLLNVLRRLEVAQHEPERPPQAGLAPADGPEAAGVREENPGEPTAAPGDAKKPALPPLPERPPLLPWPLPPQRTRARKVFQVWVVLYALVGAQMGWVLRPFIGAPSLPFSWLRGREANFFIAVLRTLGKLLGER